MPTEREISDEFDIDRDRVWMLRELTQMRHLSSFDRPV
jgi:hypothetical protein